ncbi:MAG: threonine--tRNA ligase [Candidatus Campbellbacteria bacterium]|nr:threonine--tRNA ligase [Candidatus Campbellbacteria bacterium]
MNDQEKLEKIRHSFAHLLAAAVTQMYPRSLPATGPTTENGFFYDFAFESNIPTEEELEKIENKMREILSSWEGFERIEVTPEEAREHFKDNKYKLELIDSFEDKGEKVSLYRSGSFIDLCRGGHVDDINDLVPEAFKLHAISGAYWQSDENNDQLVRISGFAFEAKESLANYLEMREEAKKRDHRKLAKELDLLVFSELIGPGLPIFTPKGNIVRSKIVEFSRELNAKIGFQEVHTPNMNKAELFKISGHYQKYEEDMFKVSSHYTDEEYYLKPMNCPQHTQLYASKKRSYRDLPIRIADFSNLYRDEKPGELAGLTRLRFFSQDDGHVFCSEDQIEEEFNKILEVVQVALKIYGLDYHIRLSLRDPENKEKYLGDDSLWERSQSMLKDLLEQNGVDYVEAPGEAAFYGPKMDIMAHDALGREWQISTVQLDFSMPERFDLTYVDNNGDEKRPVLIHRAIIGSPDRFMGILLEHFAGKLPLWLSPVQISLVPVSEEQKDITHEIAEQIIKAGLRVDVLDENDSLGKRIRNAKMERVPYIGVIGDRESKNNSISIESRDSGKLGEIKVDELIDLLKQKNTSRDISV